MLWARVNGKEEVDSRDTVEDDDRELNRRKGARGQTEACKEEGPEG